MRTAQAIGSRIHHPVEPHPDLTERNLGCFEGWPKAELARHGRLGPALIHPMDSHTRAPDGESMRDVVQRVLHFLTAARNLSERVVAAVTHDQVIQAMLATLQGHERYATFHHRNGAYAVVRLESDTSTIMGWNVADHLANATWLRPHLQTARSGPEQETSGSATDEPCYFPNNP